MPRGANHSETFLKVADNLDNFGNDSPRFAEHHRRLADPRCASPKIHEGFFASYIPSAKHRGCFGDAETSADLRRGIGDYSGILGDVSGIVRR